MKNSKLPNISSESSTNPLDSSKASIQKAVNESQLLISYASEKGMEVPEDVSKSIIESKFLLENSTWNTENEVAFWNAYSYMIRIIKPATLDSIGAIKHKKSTKFLWWASAKSLADRAVFHARMLAFISLFLLLILQIYWVVGISANSKLADLTDKIDKQEAVLNNMDKANASFKSQSDRIVSLKQQQNANYELLLSWNEIWLAALFKEKFTGDINAYRQFKYDHRKAEVQQIEDEMIGLENTEKSVYGSAIENLDFQEADEISSKTELDETEYQIEKEMRREVFYNQLWLNLLSAEYVLKALSAYFLPLLYGLLGAVMFIMRSLSKDIKNMKYTADADISYRLRITMGALGGLTIGWFISPEEGLNVDIVSTFTLAFLTGYNVELLFSVMDRMIDTINKQVSEKTENPTPPVPNAAEETQSRPPSL